MGTDKIACSPIKIVLFCVYLLDYGSIVHPVNTFADDIHPVIHISRADSVDFFAGAEPVRPVTVLREKVVPLGSLKLALYVNNPN